MHHRYQIGTQENRVFLEENARELLAFGRQFPSPGGSAYYLGDDGTPMPERPRETYETARMAHSYSLGTLLGIAGSSELADAALRGIAELEDRSAGGWVTGLTNDNEPMPDKQAYTHAFVILAASSALLAERPGARDLLDRALATFDEKFWDAEEGLAVDRWDITFTELDPYRGLNANMHTVEAYLAASDALYSEELRNRAGGIIRRVIAIARDNNWRIPEHYDNSWNSLPEYNADRPDDRFRPYGATPGHGFEWSRLTLQWALSQKAAYPELAEEYVDAAEQLFSRAASDGWMADGEPGIVYTTDWDGKPVTSDRMHWTLAEGIAAAASLYAATGRREYADWYARFMEYLDTTVRDHERGSWYHQLDAHNRPATTVWPGKPDIYHALQASLIPLYPPGQSIASAIRLAARQP